MKNKKARISKLFTDFFCISVLPSHLPFLLDFLYPCASFLRLYSDLLFSEKASYQKTLISSSRRLKIGFIFISSVTKVSRLYSSSSSIIFTIVLRLLNSSLFFKYRLRCSFMKLLWKLEFSSRYCLLSERSNFPIEHKYSMVIPKA